MKNIPNKYKYPVLGFVLLLILFFALRTPLLKMVFSKMQQKLSTYSLVLEARKVGFSGFKTVTFHGMRISLDTSTLLYIDTLKVNPRVFSLFAGRILLKEIDIRTGNFNFDISQLRKIRKATESIPEDTLDVQTDKTNYAKVIHRFINTYFEYIPSRLKMTNFNVEYRRDTLFTEIDIPEFQLRKQKYSGQLSLRDNQISENILINGTVERDDMRISFRAKNQENETIKMPYIGPRWNSAVSFDSIYGSFEVEKYRSGLLELNLSSGIHNFVVNDARIGPEPVVTHKARGDLQIRVTERAFEIDSTSRVGFNDFEFSPYFSFKKDPNRIIELKIIRQEFEAQKLFKSFPEGLFDHVTRLETKGNLIYSLHTSLNLDYPDSATLDSHMENKGFSIVKYEGEDFRKMNGSFRHEVYERNRLVRAFTVGPDNPDFAPYSQISPYLKYSILTSEDGDFFYHKGFNQNAFRESISKNWQEKRFARGGSTISMQLVKNVFLNRKKTIARKVEEMLIVWMIENLRLTSKERMFEVYLNIIEWGPDIYGVKEASRFYFNKPPAQLDLKESIFLASIVPRPKAFRFAFDTTGNLRSHYAGYYRLLSGIMVRRNQISSADTVNLRPDIELRGAARYYVSKEENKREESIFFLEPKRFIIDLFRKKDDDQDKKGGLINPGD